MQVYKAFFKIILKNLSQIMIYVVVFVSLAMALGSIGNKSVTVDFTETKVKTVFINYDEDSKLVEGLKIYLSKNSDMKDIPDETKKLQDALFFREAEYIVKVPKGFTENLLSGKEVSIDKTTVPGSTSEIYMDSMINKYLNTAKLYKNTMEDLSSEQLIANIEKDLGEQTAVELKTSADESANNEKRAFYFNYMAYSIYAILILGVCSVMIVFNNTDLKKRNHCSPVKLKDMNFQLILANLSFAVLTWFVMVLAALIMYGDYMFTSRGLLLLLNSFIFTFAALSISFLIGNIIHSKGAMSAAANVVSLGTCFISGVFVPQALLGKTVLKIASFTPNYWYVKSNNAIANMSNFSMENLTPVFFNMLVVLGFAVAILAITLVVIKQNRMAK